MHAYEFATLHRIALTHYETVTLCRHAPKTTTCISTTTSASPPTCLSGWTTPPLTGSLAPQPWARQREQPPALSTPPPSLLFIRSDYDGLVAVLPPPPNLQLFFRIKSRCTSRFWVTRKTPTFLYGATTPARTLAPSPSAPPYSTSATAQSRCAALLQMFFPANFVQERRCARSAYCRPPGFRRPQPQDTFRRAHAGAAAVVTRIPCKPLTETTAACCIAVAASLVWGQQAAACAGQNMTFNKARTARGEGFMNEPAQTRALKVLST